MFIPADVKLKEITAELHRAQDLAEKYRNLYELERRKGTKDSGEHLPPVVEDDKLPQNQSSYTFLGGNIRVNDVIRKNEVCLTSNCLLIVLFTVLYTTFRILHHVLLDL